MRRASPSPTPSTPGMRNHQGTGQTSAASLEPPALDLEASESLSSPGPHPCQFSQWRLRSREGLPGMLTPHACCGPGLEADPHAGGQEPQAQRREKWRIMLTSRVPHYGAKQLWTLQSLRGFYRKVLTLDSSGRRESASRPAPAACPSDKPRSGLGQ